MLSLGFCPACSFGEIFLQSCMRDKIQNGKPRVRGYAQSPHPRNPAFQQRQMFLAVSHASSSCLIRPMSSSSCCTHPTFVTKPLSFCVVHLSYVAPILYIHYRSLSEHLVSMVSSYCWAWRSSWEWHERINCTVTLGIVKCVRATTLPDLQASALDLQ